MRIKSEVVNPWAIDSYDESLDSFGDIPLKDKDEVEFTTTIDTQTNEVFLFARLHGANYWVGNLPFLGTLSNPFKSFERVKIDGREFKISKGILSKNSNPRSDFFRYLLDRSHFEKDLIAESNKQNVHLQKAFLAPYSKFKKEEVIRDLGKAIEKESELLVDQAIRIGALVNQKYFVCSQGYIFESEDKINSHTCFSKTSESYSELRTTKTTAYYLQSKELTPLSHAELKNHKRISHLLQMHGASDTHYREHNRTHYHTTTSESSEFGIGV